MPRLVQRRTHDRRTTAEREDTERPRVREAREESTTPEFNHRHVHGRPPGKTERRHADPLGRRPDEQRRSPRGLTTVFAGGTRSVPAAQHSAAVRTGLDDVLALANVRLTHRFVAAPRGGERGAEVVSRAIEGPAGGLRGRAERAAAEEVVGRVARARAVSAAVVVGAVRRGPRGALQAPGPRLSRGPTAEQRLSNWPLYTSPSPRD